MDASVNTFAERLREPWLTCEATQLHLAEAFTHIANALQALDASTLAVIALEDTALTLAAVLAALATGRPALLGNPQWTQAEAHTARELLGGKQVWLTNSRSIENFFAKTPQVAQVQATEIAGRKTPPLSQTDATAEQGIATAAFFHSISATAATPLPVDQLNGYLLIPTGGTGGSLKLAFHNWQTLHAAIEGYAHFWNTNAVHCVCSLPVCHIGGLMPALRTFATGGRLCLLPWRQLQAIATAAAPTTTQAHSDSQTPAAAAPLLPDIYALARNWQISLVPTQVQQLLGSTTATAWLRKMQAVLIGGGAARSDLLLAAAAAGIPLSPAYGMTEAAATVALQRPEDFLRSSDSHTSGTPPQGEVMPHLQAEIEPESGRILLSGASLFHGYFPAKPTAPQQYATSDRGSLAQVQAGSLEQVQGDSTPEQHLSAPEEHAITSKHAAPCQLLTVLGRLDNIIVSGGKKIDPAMVEQAIYATAKDLGSPVRSVLVCAVADERWGQRLIAFIETTEGTAAPANEAATPLPPATEALRNALRQRLPAYQIPKQWLCVATLPLNERGKPDRQRIAELAGTQCN